MISDWNSNFLFYNRRPHFQSTLSSSPMVGPDTLRRPYGLVDSPRARHVYRKFPCRGPSGERTVLRNLRLLVLDHTRILDREIYLRASLHVHLSWVVLYPLFFCIPPTSRQHHRLGSTQSVLPSTTHTQGRWNKWWDLHIDR